MKIGDTVFIKHKNQVLECKVKEFAEITGIYLVSYRDGLIKLFRAENRMAISFKEADMLP